MKYATMVPVSSRFMTCSKETVDWKENPRTIGCRLGRYAGEHGRERAAPTLRDIGVSRRFSSILSVLPTSAAGSKSRLSASSAPKPAQAGARVNRCTARMARTCAIQSKAKLHGRSGTYSDIERSRRTGKTLE